MHTEGLVAFSIALSCPVLLCPAPHLYRPALSCSVLLCPALFCSVLPYSAQCLSQGQSHDHMRGFRLEPHQSSGALRKFNWYGMGRTMQGTAVVACDMAACQCIDWYQHRVHALSVAALQRAW